MIPMILFILECLLGIPEFPGDWAERKTELGDNHNLSVLLTNMERGQWSSILLLLQTSQQLLYW